MAIRYILLVSCLMFGSLRQNDYLCILKYSCMKRNHLQLLNMVGTGQGVYKSSVPFGNNEDADDEESVDKRNYRLQRANFLSYHSTYRSQHNFRVEHRDPNLTLNHYDYIIIWTYKILTDDLIREWGLVLERRTDLGLKLLARVDDEGKFERFLESILEYAQDDSIIDSVPNEYAQLTLIQNFALLTSDDIINTHTEQDGNISAVLQLTGLEDGNKRQILSALRRIIGNDNLTETSAQLGLYEAEFESLEQIRYVADNIDILQSIQSFPTFRVSPGRYKMVSFTQELDIEDVDLDTLPVVGVIDTGIRDVPAINRFVIERVCLEEGMSIRCGHGTNVASLAIFGRQSLYGHLIPHARVFSIQVLEDESGKVSLGKLRQMILYGIEQYHIKIFNVSLAEPNGKEINGDISAYARMLDEISYLHDVLFVTATGNTDWTGEPVTPNVPASLYNPQDPTQTRFTNIGSPAENINGLTVGAVNDVGLPATYTKKSHLDFSMPIGNSYAEKAIVNYNLMKPDVLAEGGDDTNDDSKWIDVIEASRTDFIKKEVGTSFATPVVSNLCAQLMKEYPSLSAAAIKAVIVNSALSTGIARIPATQQIAEQRNAAISGNGHFKTYHRQSAEHIGRMIEGYGAIPENDAEIVFSDENSVSFIGQMEIENEEIKCVNIKLPESLCIGKGREKMLRVSATICFYAQTNSGNDIVTYNPYHVSFRFLRGDEIIERVADTLQYVRGEDHDARNDKKARSHIKTAMDTWSDTPLPSYKRRLFSNTQHKVFLLKAGDVINADRNFALAFRCVTKPNYDVRPVHFSYAVKMVVENQSLIDSGFSLYEELSAINTVRAIGIAEAAAEVEAES